MFILTKTGSAGRHNLWLDDRRIGFVSAPDSISSRWYAFVDMPLDEKLPTPFRFYATPFDSLDEICAFLSIDVPRAAPSPMSPVPGLSGVSALPVAWAI